MAGRPRTRPNRYIGVTCGAKNRRGLECQCKLLGRGGRCKFHGGMSTGAKLDRPGPKTDDGKARSYSARDAGRERYYLARRLRRRTTS